MFTVKATYRSETRKFSFQEHTFPTYEQLCSQLYRVFPIANAYYLSRILFCPNPHAPDQRILVGQEAHNAEEYARYTKQYQGRSFPGALLRFSVSDETPHKVPSNAKDNVVEGESLITVNDAKAVATSLEAGNALEGSDVAETPTPASITESPTAAAERQSHRAQMENERRIILERIRERIHSRSSNSPSISIPVITALPSDVTIAPPASASGTSPLRSYHYSEGSGSIAPWLRTNESNEASDDSLTLKSSSAVPIYRHAERLGRLSEFLSRRENSAQAVRVDGNGHAPAQSTAGITPTSSTVDTQVLRNLAEMAVPSAGEAPLPGSQPSPSPPAKDTIRPNRLSQVLSARNMSLSGVTVPKVGPIDNPFDTTPTARPAEWGYSWDQMSRFISGIRDRPTDNVYRSLSTAEQDTGNVNLPNGILPPPYPTPPPVVPSAWRSLRPRQAGSAMEMCSTDGVESMGSPSTTDNTFGPLESPASSTQRLEEPVWNNGNTFDVASNRVLDLGIDFLRRAAELSEASDSRSSSPHHLNGNQESLFSDSRLDTPEQWGGAEEQTKTLGVDHWQQPSVRRAQQNVQAWRTWRPLPPRPSIIGRPLSPSELTAEYAIYNNFPSPSTVTPSPLHGSSSLLSPSKPFMTSTHGRRWDIGRQGSPSCPPAHSPLSTPSLQSCINMRATGNDTLPSSRSISPVRIRSPSRSPPSCRWSLPTPRPIQIHPPAPWCHPPSVQPPVCFVQSPIDSFPPASPSPSQRSLPIYNPYESISDCRPPYAYRSADAVSMNTESINWPHLPLSVSQVSHECGWSTDCEKLKIQIETVKKSLEELRCDFERANIGKEPSHVPDLDRCGGRDKGKAKAENGNATTQPVWNKATVLVGMPISQNRLGATSSSHSANLDYACDGCKRPIAGVRHKCLDCGDFDLCTTCVSSPGRRRAHDAKHAFFPIDMAGDMTAYLAAKAERLGMKHTGVTCQGCRQQINGVRHRCLDCDNFSLCGACVGSTWTRSAHPVHHAFFPIELPWDSDAFQQAFERRKTYNILAPDAPEHAGITCDGCNKGIVGIRHKCLSCPNFDYCTQCLSNPDERFMHDLAHAFLPVPKPGDLNQLLAVRAACQEPAPPVVHKGVACNECRDEIIGVRHRCLDCPDFDLCELCISRGAKQDHNSAHQFLELVKPGEVIVHTVYNNDQPGPQEQRANVQQQDTPVVHNATCNLCDSTIRGDRYKCLNCPDFDTCGACFNITSEQHPGHGFVRVDMDNQLIIRDARRLNVVYPVICDECHNPVRGIRYKCMHPSCPDYDLCQNCEALPISVHPLTHPLLKVKTPEASIPSLLKKEEGECLKCKANSEAPLAIFTQATPAQEHQIIPTSDSTRRIEGLAEVVSVRHTDSHYRVPSCHISQPSNSSELSYANSEHHNMVAAPSLIPPWKPTNVDWHWHPTPPGPMVVPHMLSEESPALQTVVIPPCTLGQSVHSICSGDSPRSSFSEQSPFNPFRDANAVAHDVSVPPSESFSPPGLRTVAPLPMSPPPRLIDLDDPATKPVPEWLVEPATSEAQSATLAESSTSMPPLRTPSLEPELATEEWRTLVPEIGTLLKLLFKPPTPEVPSRSTTYMPGGMLAEDPTDLIESPPSEHEYRSAVESPLAAEALLSRPSAQIPEMVERPRTNGRSLTDFLGFSTLSRRSPSDSPLVVTYLSHNNIADGQFFPPGAEFVKSWRMRNDGSEPWPETTQLVFIAGDRLSPYEGAASKVKVGYVRPGQEIEMVCADMKAPDTPGAYVSYWQLHDGQVGFGDLVWVDIVVAEVNDEAGEESLAASSVIMPPAPSAPSARTNTRESVVPSTFSTPSSDDGSFDSSMSLINVPSSPSGEDDDLYQDSRARIHASPLETHRDLEYVVLYDTASSEDE